MACELIKDATTASCRELRGAFGHSDGNDEVTIDFTDCDARSGRQMGPRALSMIFRSANPSSAHAATAGALRSSSWQNGVMVDIVPPARHRLLTDQIGQSVRGPSAARIELPLGVLAGLTCLRRVDPFETDIDGADPDGVAVRNMSPSDDVLALHRARGVTAYSSNAIEGVVRLMDRHRIAIRSANLQPRRGCRVQASSPDPTACFRDRYSQTLDSRPKAEEAYHRRAFPQQRPR